MIQFHLVISLSLRSDRNPSSLLSAARIVWPLVPSEFEASLSLCLFHQRFVQM